MKISKRNGKEIHQINIWPIIESITSSADQKSLKSDNRLLTSKTGLARAAIRHFLNNQVLDCYLQGTIYFTPHTFITSDIFRLFLSDFGNKNVYFVRIFDTNDIRFSSIF